jgi:hypothetical protein
MNRLQLPVAIRTTAAALAVFMTVAILNTLIQVAGPDQSALMAQAASRQAARIAADAGQLAPLAQAATIEVDF